MGGIGKTIFGAPGTSSSSGSSSSTNLAYPAIAGAMTPSLGLVTQGGNAISNLLGLNGASAQNTGIAGFQNSPGMQFQNNESTRMLSNNATGSNLVGNSPDTAAALSQYNKGVGSTYLNQYMDQLLGLGKIGVGAGGAMAAAGDTSTGTSTGSGSGPKKGSLGDIIKIGMAFA